MASGVEDVEGYKCWNERLCSLLFRLWVPGEDLHYSTVPSCGTVLGLCPKLFSNFVTQRVLRMGLWRKCAQLHFLKDQQLCFWNRKRGRKSSFWLWV